MRRILCALLGAACAVAALAAPAGASVQVSQSGWFWGNPTPQGNTLRAVDFQAGRGYAVGDAGTALRIGDGGATWRETQTTLHGSNFGWETNSARRDGFWGDYNYVSAVHGAVNAAWTDSRDLVPGTDPRETGSSDDADGFDVFQPCTYVPNDINAASYSSPSISDPCLSQGGLDQNIYATRP